MPFPDLLRYLAESLGSLLIQPERFRQPQRVYRSLGKRFSASAGVTQLLMRDTSVAIRFLKDDLTPKIDPTVVGCAVACRSMVSACARHADFAQTTHRRILSTRANGTNTRLSGERIQHNVRAGLTRQFETRKPSLPTSQSGGKRPAGLGGLDCSLIHPYRNCDALNFFARAGAQA